MPAAAHGAMRVSHPAWSAFVADPLSGFGLADSTVPQLFSGAQKLADPIALGGIRSDLPLLVVSGQDDRLAGEGALVSLPAR